MEVAKDGLDILSTFLNAAPIPEPFKSAVTAIPDIALQILTIVETVKGNAEDAKALAIYIANVTKTTMRPFETKPQGSLDNSPAMKKRIDDFREVLEKIKDEMQALTSRRLRLRVLHYARDAATLTAFKTRVDEAVKDIQLETVMATGHEVDLISQGQERIFQEQYRVSQELLVVTQRQQDAGS
ncbi:hypothetical protein FRB94_008512 [Tulasnella sp. JGI-2019a]|nr:hypothetical protein FRB94_008512 [Tulasnella sp. JGI-2019a]KAG8999383.1 hypothetical protein FRB93_013262 [Tulasnella sp. JGI-2019a]